MLVRDWMTKEPRTVGPQTPVLTARRLMQDCRIGHLPIVDEGLLVGIVTDRELRLTLPSRTTSLAAHAITSYLLDKMPARFLLRHRLGALPVMAGGILVGILSHSDVLKAFMTVAEVGAVGRVASYGS